MPHIILLGTLDTKLHEFLYIYDQIVNSPLTTSSLPRVTLIDCGRIPVQHEKITVTQADLVSRYGAKGETRTLQDMPRGEVINYMITATTACVHDLIIRGDVHGIVSAGGTGGTSLACAVMRNATPIGMPKVIASTVASGDTSPFVGESDVTMMYSVVDIAGSNELLRRVLSNLAGAIVGMSAAYEISLRSKKRAGKLRVGVTMFGVTTPCVNKIREHLETKYDAEVFVFHATGHGGRAMERLVEEGRLDAVLDLTTTEICDHLMGGNMSAGEKRLDAALRAGIPYVLSLGATDMVNFGPVATVPEKYRSRKFLEHNPAVTLMRTEVEECQEIGTFIVQKTTSLAKDPSKVQLRIPKGGVSMIAIPGGAFEYVKADERLADTLRKGLKGSGVSIVEDERDINDEGFAVDIADQLMKVMRQ